MSILNTNDPLQNKEFLKSLKDPKKFLQFHQYIDEQYAMRNPQLRGQLIMDSMGFGKTIKAIAIASYFAKQNPDRKILVLLAKSLVDNFKVNLYKYYKATAELEKEDVDKIIEQTYKFISLNAGNMYDQVSKIQKSDEELVFEKQLGDISAEASKDKNFLENTLVIIDEAHNLFNSITNGSKNAISLYDAIMRARDIKLLFLTGTPMVNSPFELVPCFNMLRGYIYPQVSKAPRDEARTSETNGGAGRGPPARTTLFPEKEEEFRAYYVDGNSIKNKKRFQNRIYGFVSYYGNKYFDKTQEHFPTVLPQKIETIPMSQGQYSAYSVAREKELKEMPSIGQKTDRFSQKSQTQSSYRIKSRQIGIFHIPDYARGPRVGNKMPAKYIDKITPQDLKQSGNLKKYSPIFDEVLKNIDKHKDRSGYIFMQFVEGEGIMLMARVLEAAGYTRWKPSVGGRKSEVKKDNSDDETSEDMTSSDDEDDYDGVLSDYIEGGRMKSKSKTKTKTASEKKTSSQPQSKKKTYAILTSKVDQEEQKKILEAFNSPQNARGAIINIALISKVASTGVELFNSGHNHKIGAPWNMMLFDQVDTRGARYKSHESLPKKDQTLQPYVYLADYPKGIDRKKIVEPTTDIELYQKAVKGKILIDTFMLAMVEASIDCTTHESSFSNYIKSKVKCYMCAPTGADLYHPDLVKDMRMENPCQELKKSSVKAKEIILKDVDRKYYYTQNDPEDPLDVTIYEYNDSVKGYTKVADADPYRVRVLEAIVH